MRQPGSTLVSTAERQWCAHADTPPAESPDTIAGPAGVWSRNSAIISTPAERVLGNTVVKMYDGAMVAWAAETDRPLQVGAK